MSEKNGETFRDDAVRDMKDLLQAMQNMYTTMNKQPEAGITKMQDGLRDLANNVGFTAYDSGYKRVSDAAKELGRDAFPGLFKVPSKFAHPTSLVLYFGSQVSPASKLEPLLDAFLHGGAEIASICLVEIEKWIRQKYPTFRTQRNG
jgi:hypothetical protein